MESLIRAWDGESVIIRFDRAANAWIFIAIHSTRLGPAVGGTRMKSYLDLNKENIPSLKCQAVAGAANNQLGDPVDAISLRDRAILYVPDFIANSGGAIAIIGMEISGWSQEEAEKRVIQTIRENLSNIFELSETAGCSMDEAACRIADMRLTTQSTT